MREYLTTEVKEVYTEEHSLERWGGIVRYFTTQYREAFRYYSGFFPGTSVLRIIKYSPDRNHWAKLFYLLILYSKKKYSIMSTMQEATKDFLAQHRIAVVGVSRSQNKAANLIYRKLRSEGYKVFAVNPNATTLEGDINYPNLKSIPETPDAVVIVTRPEITNQVVRECAELGIKRVWMHKGIDSKSTSVSTEAIDFCNQHNIKVIPGGCPMMYCNNADFGHRFMRWIQTLTGSLPKQV